MQQTVSYLCPRKHFHISWALIVLALPFSWGLERGFILIEFGNGVRIQGFITIATANRKTKCQNTFNVAIVIVALPVMFTVPFWSVFKICLSTTYECSKRRENV